MTTKRSKSVGQALTVVFTSLIAPLVVNLIAREIGNEDAPSACQEQTGAHKAELPVTKGRSLAAFPPAPPPVQSLVTNAHALSWETQPEPILQVIAEGAGRTHEASVQQALRAALSTALAVQLDRETWTPASQARLDEAWRSGGGIIRGWKVLRTTRQWKLAIPMHYTELAVDVDRHELRNRLRAAPVLDTSGSNPVVP